MSDPIDLNYLRCGFVYVQGCLHRQNVQPWLLGVVDDLLGGLASAIAQKRQFSLGVPEKATKEARAAFTGSFDSLMTVANAKASPILLRNGRPRAFNGQALLAAAANIGAMLLMGGTLELGPAPVDAEPPDPSAASAPESALPPEP